MELFKFTNISSPTILQAGELIRGYDSVSWTERYQESGEFEINARLSSNLRAFLPLGTFISHADTMEVMIVENHEVDQKIDEDPTIKISGRSLTSYLENRTVGLNRVRTDNKITEYVLAVNESWDQAVYLVNTHINTTTNVNDSLDNINCVSICSGTATKEERAISDGDVYKGLQDILAVDDIGVKTIRRNPFGLETGSSSTETRIIIYKGRDKSKQVHFAWKSGDLNSAGYLFSDRKLKNSAHVRGKWVELIVDTGGIKYDRRFMMVDASDIDEAQEHYPTGTALTWIISAMTTRGKQALKKQTRIHLSRTDVSELTRWRYRKDYDVGDLVMVDGDWGERTVMRVVEFVEIEDENGESGHPTLELPTGPAEPS
jgi:Siphovirus ReqiPepy6 Gp37-like protein